MDERITQFVEDVTGGLAADRELRLDVQHELTDHLERTAEAFREEGMDDAASTAQALKVFGAPVEIAGELLEANKRRMHWRALLRLALQAVAIPAAIIVAVLLGYSGLVRIQDVYGHVLVIVSHQRRQIRHIAVTEHPTANWVIQQLREATPFGEQPRYVIHNSDAVFVGKDVQSFLRNAGIQAKRTAYHCPWQNGITERTIGMLRRELFDHIIPLNERHLQQLLTEYVHRYYNPVRTHQAIEHQAPLPRENASPPCDLSTPLIPEPILGGLYHTYDRAA